MTAARSGKLPRKVIDLCAVLDEYRDTPLPDGTSLPIELKKVLDAVYKASQQDSPKASLNLSLAALERENPGLHASVESWLNSEIAHEVFRPAGQTQTLSTWRRTFAALVDGGLASTAFRFAGGRPRDFRFSPAHNAALAAKYWHRVRGMASEEATVKACASVGAAISRSGWEVSRGDVQAQRAKLKSASVADLKEQFAIISEKYGFPVD